MQRFTLVTGASSGIGRAIAVKLSESRRLILHGRDSARLKESRNACARRDEHITWALDLSAPESIEESLTLLLAGAGHTVDAFVHCAGAPGLLPASGATCAAAKKIMNVNFFAAVELVRVLLRKTPNQKQLRNVVFISSVWSQFGARGQSIYCASKGALDSYMRALAVELAPEVRVNSILPGAIQTPMAEESLADPATLEKLRSDYPLGLGATGDIANAVEFLLSEKARWMTGHQLTVDGGRTANLSLK